MAEPRKIYIGAHDIRACELAFPSGKKVSLGFGKAPYITDDPEEIDFASRQTGVFIGALNDKEFRTYYTNLLEPKPVIEAHVTEAQAQEFRWRDEWEPRILEELKARGYQIRRKKPTAEDE